MSAQRRAGSRRAPSTWRGRGPGACCSASTHSDRRMRLYTPGDTLLRGPAAPAIPHRMLNGHVCDSRIAVESRLRRSNRGSCSGSYCSSHSLPRCDSYDVIQLCFPSILWRSPESCNASIATSSNGWLRSLIPPLRCTCAVCATVLRVNCDLVSCLVAVRPLFPRCSSSALSLPLLLPLACCSSSPRVSCE